MIYKCHQSMVGSTCNGRRSTAKLGPFIALGVFLCVQHGANEATRRAGPSATDLFCVSVASTGALLIKNPKPPGW